MNKVGARQTQILQLLLEERKGLSIDQIANALEISRTAILQHFSRLQKLHFICEGSLDKTAGRPVRKYCLTEQGINYFPKQYSWFSALLLDSLKKQMGSSGLSNYMYRLGEQVAQGLLGRMEDKNPAEKVEQLLSILQELGYEAVLRASDEENVPRIEAYNCVYHDVAQKHQEICEFDLALIRSLLGREIELEDCFAKGGSSCCFRVGGCGN